MSGTLPISRAVVASVRRLRKERGITALRLAELMTESGYPIRRANLAAAEGGHRKEVSVDWLWAVSQALGVPVTTVLWGPDCSTCSDSPAPGFTCNSCGKASG